MNVIAKVGEALCEALNKKAGYDKRIPMIEIVEVLREMPEPHRTFFLTLAVSERMGV